jgi:hypothetical protein
MLRTVMIALVATTFVGAMAALGQTMALLSTRAAETLIARAALVGTREGDWLVEARAALDHRPDAWATVAAGTAGRLHPADVFRA